MNTIVTKKCNWCQQNKLLNEFYWNITRTGKPYPNSRCKDCCKRLAKSRYNPKRQKELRKSEYHKQYARQYWIDHPIKYMLSAARRRAKKYGLEFNLNEEDIDIPEVCPYLGIPLKSHGKLEDRSMSLDRINPTLGYVRGNVQVISALANRMKNSATPEQLVQFAHSVLSR